jgi:hypothetical protein
VVELDGLQFFATRSNALHVFREVPLQFIELTHKELMLYKAKRIPLSSDIVDAGTIRASLL